MACLSDGGMSMNIIDFIPFGKENAITRERLKAMTGLPDREIRDMIKKERRYRPIINMQDGDGYFQPTQEEKDYVQKWLKQETRRAKSSFRSLRGAKQFLTS